MLAKPPLSCINTPDAPAAIGPYVQACRAGDFLYLSGQIPLDAVSMQVVTDDIEGQSHQVLKNMSAVIASAGGRLSDVVKTTCFFKDLNDFEVFNQVYSQYFQQHQPARSCVEVSRLPKAVRVEVEAVVFLPVS